MTIWATFPLFSLVFAFTDNPWMTTAILLVGCGFSQLVWSYFYDGKNLFKKDLWCLVLKHYWRRRWPLLAIPASIAENVLFFIALLLIDAAVANSLSKIYPVFYSLWLCSASGRFFISKKALLGLIAGCLGASLAVVSASGVAISAGWRLPVGVGLIVLLIFLTSIKSQEFAVVDDVSKELNWTKNKRKEFGLMVAVTGLRHLLAGLPLLLASFLWAAKMPANAWLGAVLFGFFLMPLAIGLFRTALITNNDVGLSAIYPIGSILSTIILASFGFLNVSNVWLLFIGTSLITIGSAAAIISHPHKKHHLKMRKHHWYRPK